VSKDGIVETLEIAPCLCRTVAGGLTAVSFSENTDIPDGVHVRYRVSFGSRCVPWCGLRTVESELLLWSSPVQPTPENISVPPAAVPVKDPWDNIPPVPALEESSAGACAFREEIYRDIGKMDWMKTVRNWPLGLDGKFHLKTRVLLHAYGPGPSNKRQPCLTVLGPDTQRALKAARAGEAGAFRLVVSDELIDNYDHSWQGRASLWTREPPCGEEPAQAALCRELMARGQFIGACEAANVVPDASVIRAAAGLARSGTADFPPDWTPVLLGALARLAPWQLAEGLKAVEDRMKAADKHAPKRGKWSRRLMNFPYQRQAVRTGLHASLLDDGRVRIAIDSYGRNARLPLEDWVDPLFLGLPGETT